MSLWIIIIILKWQIQLEKSHPSIKLSRREEITFSNVTINENKRTNINNQSRLFDWINRTPVRVKLCKTKHEPIFQVENEGLKIDTSITQKQTEKKVCQKKWPKMRQSARDNNYVNVKIGLEVRVDGQSRASRG